MKVGNNASVIDEIFVRFCFKFTLPNHYKIEKKIYVILRLINFEVIHFEVWIEISLASKGTKSIIIKSARGSSTMQQLRLTNQRL